MNINNKYYENYDNIKFNKNTSKHRYKSKQSTKNIIEEKELNKWLKNSNNKRGSKSRHYK